MDIGIVRNVRTLIQLVKWNVRGTSPHLLFYRMVKGSLRYGSMRGVHMPYRLFSYSIDVYKTAHCRTPREPLFVAFVPHLLSADNEYWGEDYYRPLTTGRTRKQAINNLQDLIAMVSHKHINNHVIINIREHNDIYVCPACYTRPKFMDIQDAMDHAVQVHRVNYSVSPEDSILHE